MNRRWSWLGTRTRLGAALLAPVLVATSMPAVVHAAPLSLVRGKQPKVTPADAAAKRANFQERARSLVSTGDLRGACREYDDGAFHLGDPVLFLDGAQCHFDRATADRDVDLASTAIERARTALDISYFHLDPSADASYQLVEKSDVSGLIARANQILDRSQALITEIEEERAAPPPAPPDAEPERREKKPGRIAIVSGAALATVGGGLLVMGAAGLGLGATTQKEAEEPTVYGDNYDSVEQRGKRANLIAIVGLAAGAAVTAAGIALIVVGKKNAKKAAEGDKVVRVSPLFGPRAGGLTLSGRF